MPDIQRLARKLAAHKITLQELCQLYMASVQLEQLVSTLSSYEGAPQRAALRTARPAAAGALLQLGALR